MARKYGASKVHVQLCTKVSSVSKFDLIFEIRWKIFGRNFEVLDRMQQEQIPREEVKIFILVVGNHYRFFFIHISTPFLSPSDPFKHLQSSLKKLTMKSSAFSQTAHKRKSGMLLYKSQRKTTQTQNIKARAMQNPARSL